MFWWPCGLRIPTLKGSCSTWCLVLCLACKHSSCREAQVSGIQKYEFEKQCKVANIIHFQAFYAFGL